MAFMRGCMILSVSERDRLSVVYVTNNPTKTTRINPYCIVLHKIVLH